RSSSRTHHATPSTYTLSLHDALPILSRDAKEHLLVLLQEDLDGGPFVGDVPEKPAEDATTVQLAWRQTIARRIEEMRSDKVERIDRKSTRLNSSHRTISYAVFCLKKK